MKASSLANQQILRAAIQKAIDNGWSYFGEGGEELDEILNMMPLQNYNETVYHHIIFNHDFAKALWGEKLVHLSLAGCYEDDVPIWKWRLQEMVVCPDPIKYIKDSGVLGES